MWLGKLSLLPLLSLSLAAQIVMNTTPAGSELDFYAQHTYLVGDTNYCTQTANTFASGGSAGTSTLNLGSGSTTINGRILCTVNDSSGGIAGGNLGFYKIDTLDFQTPANSALSQVNPMTAYGTNGDPDTPTGWNGSCGVNSVASGCNWKSSGITSVQGYVVTFIMRQDGSPYYAGDSGLLISPDGGAHWCNMYTWTQHASGHGCDATNWQATGDPPADPGNPNYNAMMPFQDASHNNQSNPLGFGFFIDYCQDQACTGMPDNADNYLYAYGVVGTRYRARLFRVPKTINSIMDPTAWQAYSCANYSPANVCDGMDSGNWTNTLTSGTIVFASQTANPTGVVSQGLVSNMGVLWGGAIYGCNGSTCAYVQTSRYQPSPPSSGSKNQVFAFPHPWGPFGEPTSRADYVGNAFWTPLRYTLTNPDSEAYHYRVVMISDNAAVHNSAGTLYFQQFDFRLGAPQRMGQLQGYGKLRIHYGPVAGAIIGRGLFSATDFYHHDGLTTDAMIWSQDFVNPTSRLWMGCYTNPGDICGRTNASGLIWNSSGASLVGFTPRFELRDTVPGTYTQITANPFNTSADSDWSATFVVKPSNITPTVQSILETGTTNNRIRIAISHASQTGSISPTWVIPAGSRPVRTTAQALSNGTWASFTVTKTAGTNSVCSSVPCDPSSANVHIYVNGVEVACTQVTAGTPDVAAAPLSIGATALTTQQFLGTLGPVLLYDRVLSATEVMHNYTTFKTDPTMIFRGITLP